MGAFADPVQHSHAGDQPDHVAIASTAQAWRTTAMPFRERKHHE
jgi:hypothetical protein